MDQNLDVNLSFGDSMGVPFDNSVDISDHQDNIIIDAPGNDIPMEFETIEEHPALMETAAEETIIPEFLSEQYTLEDNINYVQEHPVLEASTSANDTSGISIHTPASSVYGVVPTQTQYVRIKPQVSVASRAPPPRPVAIAPKPRPPRPALAGKPVKTVSIGNLLPGQKGTVLAQIGKQLVLVAPSGGTSADKKPRFVQAPPHIQAQIMQAKNAAGSIKPLFGKVIVQGTGLSARDTDSGAAAGTMGGASHNVIFASPTKHGPRFSKSPQKVVITKQPGVPTTKKVVITANPQQNFVLKNTLPTKIVSQASGTAAGRTQIHQVNVPGKGVQYIKLVTNPKPITIKPAPAPSGKTIVFDTKVNFIGNQNQPIVVTTGPSGGKVMAKPQQKLVRIAPLGSKTVPINSIVTSVRGGQSLLAPRTASPPPPPPHDSKEALRVLIENAVRESPHKPAQYDTPEPTTETTIGSESPQAERPLIVVPAADNAVPSKVKRSFSFNIDENSNQNTLELSRSPPPESDNGELELDKLRARKACNCTKSQCLKLYCDCFANGEFCYRCNCTNCHNNLDNEELRQKAIRGCLERNPNAFRPKIGKANNTTDPIPIRRHNKGCNCKRSGCLKNYCECYEAKIACSAMCKCVGCRNVTDVARRRPPPPPATHSRQPCSFMTVEVIEAVCQCLLAAGRDAASPPPGPGSVSDVSAAPATVLEEFSRCLQDIISAAHRPPETHA